MVKKILLIGAVAIALATLNSNAIADEPVSLSAYVQVVDSGEGKQSQAFKPFYAESKIEKTCVYETSFMAPIDTQVERFYYLLISSDRHNSQTALELNDYLQNTRIITEYG